MLEVHEDGKSVVSTGSREEMERDVQAMHEYGLWATMEKQRVSTCMSGFAAAPAQRADHRHLHRVRGRPAALAGLPARRAAAQRGGGAARRPPTRSRRCWTSSGPTTEPEDPVLARLFPTAYPRRRRGGRGVPPVHRGHAARRQGRRPPIAIIDALEEAGLPSELTEDGLMIDVELDRADGRDLDAVLHRPAAGPRHPARGRGGRRGRTGRRCPTTTRAPRPTTSTTGSATCRRRWSRRSAEPSRSGPARRRPVTGRRLRLSAC